LPGPCASVPVRVRPLASGLSQGAQRRPSPIGNVGRLGAPQRLVGRLLLLLFLLVGTAWVSSAPAAEADERLTVGLKAFQDQFYSLAAKELRGFLAAAPEDPRRTQVLAVLAQAELAQEDWGGARQTLEQWQAAGGDAEEALYRLAWVAARQEDARAAVAYADQYGKLPRGERAGDVYEWAAATAWQKGAFADAARLYAGFLEKLPGDSRRPAIWAGRIAALERTGAPSQAVLGEVDAALGEGLPEAGVRARVAQAGIRAARSLGVNRREAALWEVLAEVGGDPTRQRRARLETGLAATRAGDDVAAEKALMGFVAQYRAAPDVVEARLALADLARRREDWAAVLAQLEAVLAAPEAVRDGQPTHDLRRGALAAALALGNETAAGVHAAALLSGDAVLSPAERGAVHQLLGRRAAASDPGAAVDHWLAVPEGSPQYVESRLAAASLLIQTGQARQALALVQSLLDGPRAGPEVQRVALAAAEGAGEWQRAALLADALAAGLPRGSEQQAVARRAALHWLQAGDGAAYERGLQGLASDATGDMTSRWAAAELQRLTFERGEWQASVTWAERAGGTEDAEVGLRHAAALEKLGREGEALKQLEMLAAREGEWAGPALARAGSIHDRAGRWQPAREAYQAALAAGVPGDAAGWLRQRLGELPSAVPEGPAAPPR